MASRSQNAGTSTGGNNPVKTTGGLITINTRHLSTQERWYCMESLESKLDRLSPDKRREVEDFVDFLLYRSGSPQDIPGLVTVNQQPVKAAPPGIPVMAPMMMQETPQVVHEQYIRLEGPSSLGVSEEQYSPIQEVTVEVDDRISRDYMDYGQFEQPSPATEAVKKVKAKLIQKGEQDKSHHLLDWID